jgi:23S rRNA (cytosine1962-C5)-methyltransferase
MFYPKIILKPGKEQSVKRYHPWIFSGALRSSCKDIKEGDVVDIYSSANEYLATGHYQVGSIAIRILSFKQVSIDIDFWIKTIQNAFNLRLVSGLAGNQETNVYRLINAEGDGLPGLVADYYNGTLVIQFHSIGMFLSKEKLAEAFIKVLGKQLIAVYDKSETTIPFKSGIIPQNSYLYGKPETNIVTENGLKFYVDWESGQKTGFFIDQRDNRKLVSQFSENRSVLNLFGYTGAYSVYAINGGAKQAVTIDSSKQATELAKVNTKLNFPDYSQCEFVCTDVIDYLKNTKNNFDLIIVDPPAFAKHQNVRTNAVQAYKRINARVIELIRPGGIIFSFSCSQVVSKDDFQKAIFVASANSGRIVRVLFQLSQPADHPTSIYHPEGEYLKGFVLYVE